MGLFTLRTNSCASKAGEGYLKWDQFLGEGLLSSVAWTLRGLSP